MPLKRDSIPDHLQGRHAHRLDRLKRRQGIERVVRIVNVRGVADVDTGGSVYTVPLSELELIPLQLEEAGEDIGTGGTVARFPLSEVVGDEDSGTEEDQEQEAPADPDGA